MAIRVFKTKLFARFARKNAISDAVLCQAVDELIAGSIDADLGSGVFKQRIARPNSGKSGGFRTIVVFQFRSDVFFVYGFAKKDVANIDSEQLQQFRKLAEFLLTRQPEELSQSLTQGKLIEVDYGKETIQK